MGIARPTAEYAGRMLDPGGWPEADENTFYDRAREYDQVLRKVTDLLEATQHQKGRIFEGGTWSGGAANAANGSLRANIAQFQTLQDYLATVVTWHRHIAGLIVQAKADIGDNVYGTQREIDLLESDPELDADKRAVAINSLVSAAHGANVGVVSSTAEQVLASRQWKPPRNALQDLLDQKTPPAPDIPTVEVRQPGAGDVPRMPAQPVPSVPTPVNPLPVNPVTPVNPSKPVGPSKPVDPATPGTPVTPTPERPTTPVSPVVTPSTPAGPTTPTSPVAPVAPVAPVNPGTPVAPVKPAPTPRPTPQPIPDLSPGTTVPSTPDAADPAAQVRPAAILADPSTGTGGHTDQPGSPQKDSAGNDSSSVPVLPAAASGGPTARAGSVSSAATTSGAGSRPIGNSAPVAGVGSRAGTGRAPLGTTGKAPAASTPASTRPAAARATSEGRRQDSEQSELVNPGSLTSVAIPVSKARAARDAIDKASSARKSDPLRLARRIAAALNAPDSGSGDFGFFWITAVTTDGKIVAANSYGLAYIPDGVQLPDPVHMASADEAVPASDRARCATYPVVLVQQWATHHDCKLRAVIGTEEQLANTDPGAAKIVLEPDDIPESGKMPGRPRLEVVDPEAAARLAATSDERLIDLLPPAPADANPPTDKRNMLWFNVMKPMMSNSTGREAAHLQAFHAYVAHTQEVVLYEAHNPADGGGQRAAVTNWIYWQYVSGLLDSALAGVSR